MERWKKIVALLEKGISPDGLPKILLSEVHGWFSYERRDEYGRFLRYEWYRIGTAVDA